MTVAPVPYTPGDGDADLVARVRAGDDRAFEKLYVRYYARIGRYVAALVGDHGRGEDVTQEVFLSALRSMRSSVRPIARRIRVPVQRSSGRNPTHPLPSLSNRGLVNLSVCISSQSIRETAIERDRSRLFPVLYRQTPSKYLSSPRLRPEWTSGTRTREMPSSSPAFSAGLELFLRAGAWARSSCCATTAFSGAARRGPEPGDGAVVCAAVEATSTWPPTTSRSTPTRGWATTRFWPTRSGCGPAPVGEDKGRAIGPRGASRTTASPSASSSGGCRRDGHDRSLRAGRPTRPHDRIVSGGAARQVSEAIALGLDAYLTGEPTESVMTAAEEAASTSSPPATTPPRRSA